MRDDEERFEEAGANVVLIGLGTPAQSRMLCTPRRTPHICVVRPDRAAHKAYGLRRGTLIEVAGPRVWAPWVKNLATGKRQTGFGQGDTAQLPGTFVVDSEGIVRFAHAGVRSNDLPPNEPLLDTLTAIGEPDD